MTAHRLIDLLLGHRSPRLGAGSRIEVAPPSPAAQAESAWVSLWHWLRQGADDAGPVNRLQRARRDFNHALQDLHGDAVRDLRVRATHAGSLRELWHLRAELYQLIAFHLNQAEAERRLERVNRHFPARAKVPHVSTSDLDVHQSIPF